MYQKKRYQKEKEKQWKKQQKAGGFRCINCRAFVVINLLMGTRNRNHCNLCLWSKHVDVKKGDRRSSCHGGMKPIGVTFKQEGYGKQGEVMLIHSCLACSKISINRIAGDDVSYLIMDIFEQSLVLDGNVFTRQGIFLLDERNRSELQQQLFGKDL